MKLDRSLMRAPKGRRRPPRRETMRDALARLKRENEQLERERDSCRRHIAAWRIHASKLEQRISELESQLKTK